MWVWGWLLQVRIHEEPEIAVRQGDVWMAVRKAADELKPGARMQVSTPLGPWSFRLSEDAVRQRMVRVPGAGLPASRGRPAGDLYVLFSVKRPRQGRGGAAAQARPPLGGLRLGRLVARPAFRLEAGPCRTTPSAISSA